MQVSPSWEAEAVIPEPLIRDLKKLVKIKQRKIGKEPKNYLNKLNKNSLNRRQKRVIDSLSRHYKAKFYKGLKEKEKEKTPQFQRIHLTKRALNRQKEKITKISGYISKLEKIKNKIEKRIQYRDEDEN